MEQDAQERGGRMTKVSRYLALLSVALVPLMLRLLPYLLSGVPFHTDTWPQIENANVLLSKSPVPLTHSAGFDNYNIYWPGLTLFAALLSNVVAVQPYLLLPVAAPLVASLSFIVFAVFLMRLGMGFRASCVSSIIFGSVVGSTVITAGATKEAYAFPLMPTFLLLYLLYLQKGRSGLLVVSFIVFVSLLLSHHLTSVLTLLLGVYLFVFQTVAVKRRFDVTAVKGLLLIVGGTAASVYYFFVYASQVQLVQITPSFLISVVSYEIAMLLPVSLELSLLGRGGFSRYWTAGVIFLAVLLPVALSSVFPVTANAPVVPKTLLAIGAPYIVVVVISALSFLLSKGEAWRGALGFSRFWGLGLLGIILFEVFGTPGDIGTALRIADFVFPAAIVASVSWVSGSSRSGLRRAGLVALTSFVVLLSLAGVIWVSYYSGELGGSQRVYTQSDLAVSQWVALRLQPGENLSGDARYSYLMALHPSVTVNLGEGYRIVRDGRFGSPGCILLSSLVSKVGYVGGEYGLPVNITRIDTLTAGVSALVPYFNGESTLVCSAPPLKGG